MSKWIVIKSIEEMKAFYEQILPKIIEVAKSHGYALGVHGSLTRDFDLIATPWIDEYSDKNELVTAMQKEACGFTMEKYQWEIKPHSRVATSFPVCFIDYQVLKDERKGLGHIDLSIVGVSDGK